MNKFFLVLIITSYICMLHAMDPELPQPDLFKFLDITTHKSVDLDNDKPRFKFIHRPANLTGEQSNMRDDQASKISLKDLFYIKCPGEKYFCCSLDHAQQIPKFQEVIKKGSKEYEIQHCSSKNCISILKVLQAGARIGAFLSCDQLPTESGCIVLPKQPAYNETKKTLSDVIHQAQKENFLNALNFCLADLYKVERGVMTRLLLSYHKKGGATELSNDKKSEINQDGKNSGYFSYFTNHPYVTFGCIVVLSAAISVWYFKDSLNLNFGSSSK